MPHINTEVPLFSNRQFTFSPIHPLVIRDVKSVHAFEALISKRLNS